MELANNHPLVCHTAYHARFSSLYKGINKPEFGIRLMHSLDNLSITNIYKYTNSVFSINLNRAY